MRYLLYPLLVLLGAGLGLALGLYGPVLFAILTGTGGTGSYEVFLPYWIGTVPGGAILGGWAGYSVAAGLLAAVGGEAPGGDLS